MRCKYCGRLYTEDICEGCGSMRPPLLVQEEPILDNRPPDHEWLLKLGWGWYPWMKDGDKSRYPYRDLHTGRYYSLQGAIGLQHSDSNYLIPSRNLLRREVK